MQGALAAFFGLVVAQIGRLISNRLEQLLDRGFWPACRQPLGFSRQQTYWPELFLAAAMATFVTTGPDPLRRWELLPFCAGLWIVAWADWQHKIAPDLVTAPLIAAGLLRNGWEPTGLGMGLAVAGLALGTACGLLVRALGKNGLGLGDVKLLAAIGSWLGPVGVLAVLSSASTLMFLVMAPGRKNPNPDRSQPFTPLLAATAALWLLL